MRLAAARENNQQEGSPRFLYTCSGWGGSIGVRGVSGPSRRLILLVGQPVRLLLPPPILSFEFNHLTPTDGRYTRHSPKNREVHRFPWFSRSCHLARVLLHVLCVVN
jgi:hypothetical protein